jgi:hypothetical protein
MNRGTRKFRQWAHQVVPALLVGTLLAAFLAWAGRTEARPGNAPNATGMATAQVAPTPDRSVPDRCAACHTPPTTYHYGLACGRCHSASRFVPAKVARPAHPLPLEGRHTALQCTACHAKTETPSPKCTACHTAPKGHPEAPCSTCHGPVGWAESAAAAGITGPPAPHLVSASDDCLACHAPDGPNWPAPAGHKAYNLGQCRLCHRSSGKASVTLDHSRVPGLLQGRHVPLACVQCHSRGQFAGTPQVCGACHQADDHHSGQFGQDCGLCHNPSGWAGVTFDHGQTGFPLTGAHTGAGCTSCHSNGQFQGTPSECSACHSEPAYHAGVLGTDCAACHTTGGWLPGSYGGPHTFPLHHKGAQGCRTCHPGNLAGYTCYGCHSEGSVAEEHQEQGIPDWSDCVGCHPNGSGG